MKNILLTIFSILTINVSAEVVNIGFVPMCAYNHITLSEQQIRNVLDSVKNLYTYKKSHPIFLPEDIIPNYKHENSFKELYKFQEHVGKDTCDYILSRLTIIRKDYNGIKIEHNIHYMDVISLIMNPDNIVKIKPEVAITYNPDYHINNAGISARDGIFSVKEENDGNLFLLCEKDKYNFTSVTLMMRDGTIIIREGNNKFNIMDISYDDIAKIRLLTETDKYDFDNKYIGEMISLMAKAAVINFNESKEQNQF